MSGEIQFNLTAHQQPKFNTSVVKDSTDHILNEYLPYEKTAEGTILLLIAIVGISLNILILISVFATKPLRSFINGFIVHDCILNAFKSALCIPYALSLLEIASPVACNTLGLAYIIALSVSMFNLLAIIMSDAYIFHEKNISEPKDDKPSGLMCLLFGISTIYIGSVILHLGPTLIGGEFKHNKEIGNCTFAYGKVQNYIVQLIWVSITTLTLVVIFQYIFKFYRHLRMNSRFRITNLARNAAAYTKGENPNDNIYSVVNRMKKKVRVFVCITLIYCICWYPLFILTLMDYNFRKKRYLYRILTVIAWSHSAFLPIARVLLDTTYGFLYQIRWAVKRKSAKDSPSAQKLTMSTANSSAANSVHSSIHNNLFNNTGLSKELSLEVEESSPKKQKRQRPPRQNSATSCGSKKEMFIRVSAIEEDPHDLETVTQAEIETLLNGTKFIDESRC